MAPTHRRGPWVPEEDQLLLQLVREQGPNNWVRISQHMHYRSPKQCRERFHQNLKPSLNREPISAEEGLMIERMVNEMGNRSDNAVKNWWNGSMNRKRRGLSVSAASPSRTFHGRVEAPYPRASMALSSPPSRSGYSISHDRPLTSWTDSPTIEARRDSSAGCSRQLSPIFTLPTLNRPVETPLTSPTYSDASRAPSLGSPSMVSDHNSVSSASPRTVASPQLLPLLGDFRRQSQGLEDVYVNHPYARLKVLEPFSDAASKPRWIPDPQPWNQPSTSLSQSWTTSEPVKAEPRRDSRMGLDNLLN
ncbi:putative MYB family conidiophore development protein FlbD [Aspergillus clavatus NRRL 1]|uniref:MYB family conidiophore development protein FlbD, putative n=1 Tax=Aspergillus clavatus (strain ATCC 1007 / CBS 513.65 / DSM 816 / NCTC 3887 / NRRL 1 / QM 1276 / 107) TaxID=344612 RepID=A1CRX1_ASPCL|nr:MYB family conidiophore development protein FlbD, putative [Aspergillus clavatus NRRL 1]EAW08392.1 MYB family conidiophore development protein FlbD, putative [Aspergillus clavatus NRRL 1]